MHSLTRRQLYFILRELLAFSNPEIVFTKRETKWGQQTWIKKRNKNEYSLRGYNAEKILTVSEQKKR